MGLKVYSDREYISNMERDKKQYVAVSLRYPPELHAKLKKYAYWSGLSMNSVAILMMKRGIQMERHLQEHMSERAKELAKENFGDVVYFFDTVGAVKDEEGDLTGTPGDNPGI